MRRITVNLTAPAARALDRLAQGGNQTDQVNAALRLAAAMRELVDEDGSVTVLGPGRTRTRVLVL